MFYKVEGDNENFTILKEEFGDFNVPVGFPRIKNIKKMSTL